MHDAVEEQPRAARTPRAGGEAADEGQAAQDLGRLLDEALDGEGVRVGEQEADLVGAGVLRHAADDEPGLGAARVEAERRQRRVRQRGRPDGDRGPRLDAPAVADHAAGAAADGHARPGHLHRPRPGAPDLVGVGVADEDGEQVGSPTPQRSGGLRDGVLGGGHEIGSLGQPVPEIRHRPSMRGAPAGARSRDGDEASSGVE